jgi:hypothetical protein
MAIAILVGVIFWWSVRNYNCREYYGPTDMRGVLKVEGLIASGFFEPNGLLITDYPTEFNIPINNDQQNHRTEPGFLFYKQYLIDKYVNQYSSNGWYLRGSIFNTVFVNGYSPNNQTIFLLDETLNRIARTSDSLLPWQAHVASLLRVGWWAVAWPDETTFDRKGFRYNYQILDTIALQESIRTDITALNSKLIYDVHYENPFSTAFSEMAARYYKAYFILLLIAFLSGLYAFWCRKLVFGSPFLIFTANIALNVFLLGIRSRYVHIFDIFLVFQAAIGITLIINELKAGGLLKLRQRRSG